LIHLLKADLPGMAEEDVASANGNETVEGTAHEK